MLYVVEFVCSGNNGRSPMAESIGKAYVAKKGLEDLTVISSGTVVGNSIWTYERANRMITQANKAGFLDGTIDEEIYNSNADYKSEIDTLAKRVLHEVFQPLDAALRDAALVYSGFPSIKDRERKPTKAHHNGLILGMNPTHAEKIKKIYEGTDYTPTIDVLGAYAGIDIDTEDNLGSLDIEKYKTMCNQMKVAVPIAIDRFLDEKAV